MVSKLQLVGRMWPFACLYQFFFINILVASEVWQPLVKPIWSLWISKGRIAIIRVSYCVGHPIPGNHHSGRVAPFIQYFMIVKSLSDHFYLSPSIEGVLGEICIEVYPIIRCWEILSQSGFCQ